MSSRASSLRSHDLRTTRRAPLRESSLTTNVQEEVRVVVVGQLKDVKPLIQSKSLSKSISASPARRVPKTIATPAKRPTRSRRSISPVLQSDLQPKSPAKRNLGSPVRRSIPVKPLHSTELGSSGPISGQALMQTFAKSLTSEGTSLSLRHERQTTSPEKSSKGQGKSSPLRKALRQPRDAVSIVPNTVSPSKNLPARHHARTPRAFPPSANALPKLSPPSSVDELILAAPSQTSIKARSIGHHGSNAAQTCSSSRNSNETGIDEDEIAAPLYTPIKSPYTTQYAQSPPTEEHMMDDDDLWTPSVPLELAQSFSEMSFREEDLVVPLKEPAHTFFDDDGEMIISKTLPMTNEYDQIEADHLHTSASDIKVYVDCTSTDQTSSSKYFSSILSALGATTLCRWNWNPETQTTPRKQPRVGLTHVVFFDGAIRTLKKVKEARRLGVEVKCVGLSWVVQCQNSGRLTIGTEGHEIDVEAELLRMTQSPRKSREPLSITDATKPAERPSAIGPSDIFASRDFEDENEDVLSRGPGKTLAAARPIVTLAARAPSKTTKLTDFEVQQLALARRNSAKFRPSISSPLSKKTWRA